MAQGRGYANRGLIVGLTILCVLAITQPTLAAVYNIGWTYNVVNWPKGKYFKAGDYIVFKYIKSQHNVVRVSEAGYKTCTSPKGAKVYQTGYDRIQLVRGTNYFICAFGAHCKSNMKIAVKAV